MNKNNKEGFDRCGICDYCELSHGKQNRTFYFDKFESIYICSECYSAKQEALSEFPVDDLDKEQLYDLNKVDRGYRWQPKYNKPSNKAGAPTKISSNKEYWDLLLKMDGLEDD